MLVKYIIKVFLYLILAVMTLIHWLLKIPMILGNILLYFLSIIFILTGVLSYGFALESARECGRMIIIGMAFGAIPDFVPFWGKSLETLVAKLLPAGVKGLVVCGILAALMSSLASLFNSSAMLFTIDFYKRFKPKTSEKKLVGIGQAATVVIVILGILWIPIMRSVGDVLYTYLQDVQSVLAPGIAAAFLLGICWKRTSAQGGMWGLIAGMVIGLTRLGAKVYYSNAGDVAGGTFKYLFYDMNWLFFCGWMFLFCIIVVILVSLATKAPSAEKIQGLVFGTSTPEQLAETRVSWNHWDIIHTLIILGITAAFYIYFW